MTLHLIKLCVGAASIEDLAAWQAEHRAFKAKGGRMRVFHTTFQTPKREAELLDGGSLYWVIKGAVQCRQRLLALEEGKKDDGSLCCKLVLEPEIIPVRPQPRKAFQGWRYFALEDAPPDITSATAGGLDRMPPQMRKELAALCLI